MIDRRLSSTATIVGFLLVFIPTLHGGVYAQEEIDVILGVDYGNNTRMWSPLHPLSGLSLLNATRNIARVEVTVYPGLGSFVDSINGVHSDPYVSRFWLWYYWSSTREKWVLGPVAADNYVLRDGEVLVWFYSSSGVLPSPPPTTRQVGGLAFSLVVFSGLPTFVGYLRLRRRK